jgi:aminodeoxyfutalosine synthase
MNRPGRKQEASRPMRRSLRYRRRMGLLDLVEGELASLARAVAAGERIGPSGCLHLWQTRDLTGVAALANFARERTSGNTSVFRRAAFLNYNGLPVPSFPECPTETTGALDDPPPEKIPTVYLLGGPDPRHGIQDLLERFERVRRACPAAQVRAFTWDSLEAAAAHDEKSPAEVISALAAAGLRAVAGGALNALSLESPHLDRDSRARLGRRLPWIQAAADAGLKCELSWMYGDGDDPEVMTGLLECIRALQDRYQVFECFSPLLFSCPPEDAALPMPTGYNQLRAIAVARLFVDNIPRIRASRRALGDAMTQVAQWYGADDAGFALTDESDSLLADLIRAAGREPRRS